MQIIIHIGMLVRYESNNNCFKEASLATRNQCTVHNWHFIVKQVSIISFLILLGFICP